MFDALSASQSSCWHWTVTGQIYFGLSRDAINGLLLTLWSFVTVVRMHPPVAEHPTGDHCTCLTAAFDPCLLEKFACLPMVLKKWKLSAGSSGTALTSRCENLAATGAVVFRPPASKCVLDPNLVLAVQGMFKYILYLTELCGTALCNFSYCHENLEDWFWRFLAIEEQV